MIALDQRTVPAMLRRGARDWPEKPALVAADHHLTYAELLEQSMRVAGGLAVLGVEPGDAVALMLDNSIEHVLGWFGASCLNAAEIPLNTSFMPDQMSYAIAHSDARVLLIDVRYVERLVPIADRLVNLRAAVLCGDEARYEDEDFSALPFEVVPFSRLLACEPAAPVAVLPGDALGILYTSGTTGAPKGVVVSQAQTYGRMWPGGPGAPGHEDRTLVVLPIYHVIGQCRALYNTLIVGGTAVLAPRFSATNFWETCRQHSITFVPLVGVMVSYLLRQPASPSDVDHVVRHVALGTTSPELEAFRQRFAVREISMSYGLTEAGGVLVGDAEPSGCGYLRPDFEARLVDEYDREVGKGEIGELVLRPTEPWTTMTGYFKMPQETLGRWRNLWLHTGDLMWQRADEMFMFAGRSAERIRVRGENVSPSEVEHQIANLPGIAECAVVGIDAPDPGAAVGEQEILALIVAESGVELDFPDIAARLSEVLPRFAVPRFFRARTSLPRTEATQRVQRTMLATQDLRDVWDREADTHHRRGGSATGAARPPVDTDTDGAQ